MWVYFLFWRKLCFSSVIIFFNIEWTIYNASCRFSSNKVLNSVWDDWLPLLSSWKLCDPNLSLKKNISSSGYKNDSSFSIAANPEIKPETTKLPLMIPSS